MNISLNRLHCGEKGEVVDIRHDTHMNRRLQDLGVVENATIQRINAAPGGDPVVYLICGAMIALRNADSAKIVIKKSSKEGSL